MFPLSDQQCVCVDPAPMPCSVIAHFIIHQCSSLASWWIRHGSTLIIGLDWETRVRVKDPQGREGKRTTKKNTLTMKSLSHNVCWWWSAVLITVCNSYTLPLPSRAPPSTSVFPFSSVRSLPAAGFPAGSPPQQEMNSDRQISRTFIFITLSALAHHSHKRSISSGNT